MTDAQGAILPGVTVTATGASSRRSDDGHVGDRQLSIPRRAPRHLHRLLRVGRIQHGQAGRDPIALGFTATMNVELALAALQETVTVSGQSPVIDTTATRVVQTSSSTSCSRFPTPGTCGRCWPSRQPCRCRGWTLVATGPAPRLGMWRTVSGRVRVLIEGIDTTEGTGGAGFYWITRRSTKCCSARPANRPKCPTRGAEPIHRQVRRQSVQRRVLHRLVQQLASGDEHSRLVPQPRRRSTTAQSAQVATRSTVITTPQSMLAVRSDATSSGGSDLPDAVQRGRSTEVRFRLDVRYQVVERLGKFTYQANPNHKLIGYYQWGRSSSRTACRSRRPLRLARADLSPGLWQLGVEGRVERRH